MRVGSPTFSALRAPSRVTSPVTRVPGVLEEDRDGPRLPDVGGTDSVELSPEAEGLFAAEAEPSGETEENAGALRGTDGEPLSPEEEDEVRKLQARDQEVRAHEEAHKAAAGDLALSGPTYDYETGPDGRDYAVGGEVQIALKSGRTPEETVKNAQRARRAALAPAEPSAQDLKVAAEAAQMEAEAMQEATKAREAELRGDGDEGEGGEGRGASAADLERRASAYEETSQAVQSVAGDVASDLLDSLLG